MEPSPNSLQQEQHSSTQLDHSSRGHLSSHPPGNSAVRQGFFSGNGFLPSRIDPVILFFVSLFLSGLELVDFVGLVVVSPLLLIIIIVGRRRRLLFGLRHFFFLSLLWTPLSSHYSRTLFFTVVCWLLWLSRATATDISRIWIWWWLRCFSPAVSFSLRIFPVFKTKVSNVVHRKT